ncbi:hypothetical protein [Rhizobium sp.]|uniref:hypothetical protein n=1 Tax=Rhizobium sp. TaxID=391 RepID=UPI0028AEB816
MLLNDNVVPDFGSTDFSAYASKRRFFEKLQQSAAAKPTKRTDRLLSKEMGACTTAELRRKLELVSLREDAHYAWFLNCSSIIDISAAMDQLVDTTPKRIPDVPRLSYYASPYIRFGEHARLRLTRSDRSIHGVFIRPYRAPDGEPWPAGSAKTHEPKEFAGVAMGFQLLTCTSPLKSVTIAALEGWATELSAFCCSSFVAGRFQLVDGDPVIVVDPAIKLANMIAIQTYLDNLSELNRSAPPRAERIVVTL